MSQSGLSAIGCGPTSISRSCASSRLGLVGLIPRLFGYSEVDVSEQECALGGAPACRFRLRWREPDATAPAGRLPRGAIAGGRDPAGGRPPHRRRPRFRRESRPCPGPDRDLGGTSRGCPVAMCSPSSRASRRPVGCTRAGLDPRGGPGLGGELLATKGAPSVGRLIADVASSRRSYGRLAAHTV